jgi:uncharacterized protein YprB with RNaseH-like and TPR domain
MKYLIILLLLVGCYSKEEQIAKIEQHENIYTYANDFQKAFDIKAICKESYMAFVDIECYGLLNGVPVSYYCDDTGCIWSQDSLKSIKINK